MYQSSIWLPLSRKTLSANYLHVRICATPGRPAVLHWGKLRWRKVYLFKTKMKPNLKRTAKENYSILPANKIKHSEIMGWYSVDEILLCFNFTIAIFISFLSIYTLCINRQTFIAWRWLEVSLYSLFLLTLVYQHSQNKLQRWYWFLWGDNWFNFRTH